MYWDLEKVQQHLQEGMERETEVIWKVALEYEVSMRTAAYIHSLKRLDDAMGFDV